MSTGRLIDRMPAAASRVAIQRGVGAVASMPDTVTATNRRQDAASMLTG